MASNQPSMSIPDALRLAIQAITHELDRITENSDPLQPDPAAVDHKKRLSLAKTIIIAERARQKEKENRAHVSLGSRK